MYKKVRMLCIVCVAFSSLQLYGQTPLYSDYEGNGYTEYQPCNDDFTPSSLPVTKARWTAGHATVLKQQQDWLAKLAGKQKLSDEQKFITNLSLSADLKEVDLTTFTALLSPGERCGNTLLTGYVTAELKMKRQPDSEYRYPVYKKPLTAELQHLSRTQIEQEHRLAAQNLEIGYGNSLLDIFLLQVQGSGYVHFLDTDEHLTLGYGGKNGYAYASLGKYMIAQNKVAKDKMSIEAIRHYYDQHPNELEGDLLINQSYLFFHEQNSIPKASNSTNVVAGITVAVDDAWIPHGSLLLVEFPVLDKNKQIVKRDYRLMFANDRGGNIKGAGRVDVYLGTDEISAGRLNQYGRVWLLKY